LTRVFDTPINTNDQSVDRVLAAGLPVLVVFLKGPASPEVEQAMEHIAREYAGELLVAKLQVEDNPSTTARFQVTGPSAVVAFIDGAVQSKGQSINAADLEAHALYLSGKGPKPFESSSVSRSERSNSQNSGDGHPIDVSDATFEQQVLQSLLPVVVDFWAPWCGPCRMVAPILDKLARENTGKLRIVKLNVDENPQIAGRYGVRSIPTMMVVKNGQVIDQWVGALPEPALRQRIAHLL
jgi:thioredoxin 1